MQSDQLVNMTNHSENATEYSDGSGITEDAKLVSKINRRLGDVREFYEKLKKEAEENRKYYAGEQANLLGLTYGESPTIVNRIFASLETIIPIATRRTPEPDITVIPRRSQKNRQLSEKLGRHLKDQWEIHQKMQHKQERGLRNLFCSRYIAFKYFYDEDERCSKFKLMPMGRLAFPDKAEDEDDLPFIVEYVTNTYGELVKKFPEKEEELKLELQKHGISEVNDDTRIEYVEYWENDSYTCKFGDCILTQNKNPNYNWPAEESEGQESEAPKPLNHFAKPKKPYIFLNFINWGDSVIDDVAYVTLVRSLQDNINKRKRQIDLNADMANGKFVVAGAKMSKADAANITNDPGEIVYLPGQETTQGALDVLTSRAFDQGIYQDMQDSKQETDNILGTHSTTRGERESTETATGRAILKESDTGRIELLMRNTEVFAQKCYDAMIQMAYVWYTDQHPIHSLPETNSETELSDAESENYIISSEFEDCKVTVLVKQGSTTPVDKATLQAQAIDLAIQGKMSTQDMYDQLDYPDPNGMAARAIQELVDPASMYSDLVATGDYDVEAIRHIREITEDIISGDAPEDIFENPDPEVYGRHTQTNLAYIQGKEVHEDLLPYSELSEATQIRVQEHIRMENMILDQLIAEQEQQLSQMRMDAGLPAEAPVEQLPQEEQEQTELPPPPAPEAAPML